jgi:hypothetical protein
MSWLTRRAIAAATATLHVRHYKDDNNVEHIDIEQKIASGLPGTTENRTLDWTFRESSDFIFGPVLGKSRRVPVDEIDNEFLRNGWMPDTVEHGVIDAYMKSDTPKSKRTWMVEQVRQHFRCFARLQNTLPIQVWGFEEINGERRHVRHVDFIGPKDEHIQARLVFDFHELVLLVDMHETNCVVQGRQRLNKYVDAILEPDSNYAMCALK